MHARGMYIIVLSGPIELLMIRLLSLSNHIAGEYAAGEICRIFRSRAHVLRANAGKLLLFRTQCLQLDTNLNVIYVFKNK